MAEILDKMIAADVIVMATPVYFYAMNAQIKTLIPLQRGNLFYIQGYYQLKRTAINPSV